MKNILIFIKQYLILIIASFLISLVLIIPIRLTIAKNQVPQPQALFTLGGDVTREKYTAELAPWYPSLDIWVSSPPDINTTKNFFKSVSIPDTRVHIDFRAVDTVTNFTTLVSDFEQYKIQHLYLITSDYHMPRAKAIATLVLGSHGIAFTPLSVPSDRHTPESNLRIIRDMIRSVLWIFTGYTGAKI